MTKKMTARNRKVVAEVIQCFLFATTFTIGCVTPPGSNPKSNEQTRRPKNPSERLSDAAIIEIKVETANQPRREVQRLGKELCGSFESILAELDAPWEFLAGRKPLQGIDFSVLIKLSNGSMMRLGFVFSEQFGGVILGEGFIVELNTDQSINFERALLLK